MIERRTIATVIEIDGIGVHSAQPARLRISPFSHGIRFRRMGCEVPADLSHLSDSSFSNTVSAGKVGVRTVEHLMAAFAVCGVSDALVEIDGGEVPILDGSAGHFCSALRRAGICGSGRPALRLHVIKSVQVADGQRTARLEPCRRLELDVLIDFEQRGIGPQRYCCTPGNGSDFEDIIWARTFGFAADAGIMRARGLALASSPDNTVIFDGGTPICGALRFPDEPARHKALDALGDLALLGLPIVGRYVGHMSGHALNARLIRRLLSDSDNYRIEYC